MQFIIDMSWSLFCVHSTEPTPISSLQVIFNLLVLKKTFYFPLKLSQIDLLKFRLNDLKLAEVCLNFASWQNGQVLSFPPGFQL